MTESQTSLPTTLIAGAAALVVVIVLVVASSGDPHAADPTTARHAMVNVARQGAVAGAPAAAKLPLGDSRLGAEPDPNADHAEHAAADDPHRHGAAAPLGHGPTLDDDEDDLAHAASLPATHSDARRVGWAGRGPIPSVPIPPAAARQVLDGGQLATAIDGIKGRLLRCVVDAVALPDRLPRAFGAGMTHERVRAYCRGRTGGSHLLEIGFNPDTVGALPAIGRGAEVIVQIMGASPTGAPQARYLRVDAGARRPVARLRGLPDLFAAWLQPIQGQRLDCVSAGPVELLGRGVAEAKQIRETDPRKGQPRPKGSDVGTLGRVRCLDRRDVPFPVLVHFPRAVDALRVVDGTTVRLTAQGRARGQLLARSERVLADGMPVDPADLRRVLVAPKAYVGTRLRCTSMGVPPPQQDAETHPKGTSARWAWVVCVQRRAPPVHLRLFFAVDRVASLLQLVRSTVFEADVVGVRASHIDAIFRAVVRDGASPAAQKADLRRYVLLNDELKGKPLTCELLFDVAVPAPHPDARDKPLRIPVTCKDPARPDKGQPFDLRFERPPAPGLLRRGARLKVSLDGLRHGRPRARYVAKITAPL